MPQIVTKSFAALLVAAFLISPLTTPVTVDAQARGGVGAVAKPTASITVGGAQSHTVATGEGIPAIVWRSTGGTKFKTHLMVNNPGLCNGVTDNQAWGQGGNTANGSFKLPNAPKAREGCVMTFVYTVTNKLGQTAVDRATVRYTAPKATTPVVTPPVVKPPVIGGNGGNATSTPPGTGEKLKLLTPNGGEKWMLNSDNTIITWSPNPHADGMVAHLEKKTGSLYTVVGKMVESKKGSIHWSGEIYPVGSTSTRYADPGEYYVRILNTKTGETDRSDAPFTVVAADTFSVNLQPKDEYGMLYIDEASLVRLSWDVTQGVQNVTCTLTTFNEYGERQSSLSVAPSGFKEVWAPKPDSGYNNGIYTLAHITCQSPLGSRTSYVTIGLSGNSTGTTSPKWISVGSLEETAILDQSDFSGDDEKGIYEFKIEVMSDKDIYIRDTVKRELPASDDRSAGFVYNITTNGVPFSGTTTAYIADSSAERQNTTNDGRYYKVRAGQREVFTVRVELNPTGMSSGKMYGIKLTALQHRDDLQYSGMEILLLEQFTQPGLDFQTNKITIASALPTGTITPVAQGATGDKVSLVQAALKKAGLFNEEITGYFGSITKAAITAFQRENALDNVGAVGPKTAQLLNQVLAQ